MEQGGLRVGLGLRVRVQGLGFGVKDLGIGGFSGYSPYTKRPC